MAEILLQNKHRRDTINLMRRQKQPFRNKLQKHKKPLIVTTIIVLLAATLAAFYFWVYLPSLSADKVPAPFRPKKAKLYSSLSGEKLKNAADDKKPITCVQVPNGMDGARPQAGLHSAKIVFEAIAEAGITRFAAVFQNQQDSVIGPIRSLRPYFYDFDRPLNCTVVHAGGSDEALNAIRGYERDLTESHDYMWRNQGSWQGGAYLGYIAPNNLFTSTDLLNSFNKAKGIEKSDFKAFKRMTPKKAKQQASKNKQVVERVDLSFGSTSDFNVYYVYERANNSYARFYASGQPHLSYACAAGQDKPNPKTHCGKAEQLRPKVVVAMVVKEWRHQDGYHEEIKMTGSGKAVIFQNGKATKVKWQKKTAEDQIKFIDKDGKVVPLAPGQTWISAIPEQAGKIAY